MKESNFRAALRLLEDAIALARSADAVSWLVYLSGIIPFFALVLYQMTSLEQSPFASEQVLALAFVLALLFLWMHVCQAVFCGRLYAIHTEDAVSLGRSFRQALTVQAVVAGTKVWAWPIGLSLLVPHAAITMFYQSSLIASGSGVGDWRSTVRDAKQDASYRPGVAIWMLVVVFLLRCIVWINLVALLFSLPGFWKTLTGMESEITRWPELINNATSLSAVTALAYLAFDPVVKAACVLRRFERQSLRSGLDLRLRLKVLGRAAVLLAMFTCASTAHSWAADTAEMAAPATQSDPSVTPLRMHQAIRSVFRDPAEAWNLPLVEPHKKSHNPLFAFMDAVTERTGKWWNEFGSWLRRVLERQQRPTPPETHGPASGTSAWLLVSVFSGLVGTGVVVAWWRKKIRPEPKEMPVTGAVATAIDIVSDMILPDDQPEDEWIRLAREHRANGNTRLALRALYLSILAALARASLITVARGKSNRDYLREVQRRGRRRGPELSCLFGRTIQVFEQSWYGTFLVTETVLEDFEGDAREVRESLVDVTR